VVVTKPLLGQTHQLLDRAAFAGYSDLKE